MPVGLYLNEELDAPTVGGKIIITVNIISAKRHQYD